VSLLRDAYVDVSDDLARHLATRFRTEAGINDDPEAFSARLDLMGVQRNLKALGTFGYQAVARANPAYAQYVPRTLGYVRDALGRHADLGRLRDVLTALIPEVGP
jgi:aminoglycoside/choline kinase family phosphotransferase